MERHFTNLNNFGGKQLNMITECNKDLFFCNKYRIFDLSTNIKVLGNRQSKYLTRVLLHHEQQGQRSQESRCTFPNQPRCLKTHQGKGQCQLIPEDRGERNGARHLLKLSTTPYKQIATLLSLYFCIQPMSKHQCAGKLSQDRIELIMCAVATEAQKEVRDRHRH